MTGRAFLSTSSSKRELVLVGGGHAHVQVLRRFIMKPDAAVRLTVVVDRYEAVYSGMVPGLVAGDYRADDLTIDVLPLARRAGACCILSAATGVDPTNRRIELDGRPPIAYDIASLDIGSTVRDHDVPGVDPYAVATRPIGRFVHAIEERLTGSRDSKPLHAVVVGGGAAGVELALCLDARLRAAGRTAKVTLAMASETILPGGQAYLARRIEAEATSRGIRIARGQRVVEVLADAVLVESTSGEPNRWPSDLTIWATGAAPHHLLEHSPLPLTAAGFIRVDANLEVLGCPDLFAVGDCAVPEHAPWIPRAGVYAVRQGPVLEQNLRARLAGRPLRAYRPQRDFLSLLNLGDGHAVGGKWGIGAGGRSVHRLKDWIDRRFMARFRVLDAEGAPAPAFPSPESMGGGETNMVCGGCAAKVGLSPLHTALARLDTPPLDDSVQVGIGDDAAVVRLPRGDVLLATVDGFRAFVDDPWLVGRVAAVNAASDVLAKAGRPRHALALVTVPDDAPAQNAEMLFQVLAGIRAGLDPLGVSLVGGHSTSGPELFVGLSITGEPVNGDHVLGLDGLRPGDRLVLSKPLGSGVLLAADMRGLARGRWLESLIPSMLQDNTSTSHAAIAHAVHACTDISGFGLAGHLLEMLDQSRLSANLSTEAIPAYEGVMALLHAGLRSTFHDQNAVTRARIVVDPGIDPTSLDLLFDPQTSGGLLMGVACDSAEDLVRALRAEGNAHAAVIGVVTSTHSLKPAIRLLAPPQPEAP